MSLLRGVGATLLAVLPLTASSVAYGAPLAPAAGQAATTTVIQPAALGAQSSQSSQSAAGTESAAYAQTILTRVNALRSELGLAPVTRYTELDTIAQTWSEQMAGGGTMTHNPDFSGQYPTGWSWAAENVAMRGSSSSGEDIGALLFEQWRSSPGHYQNMTDPDTNAIGVGIAYNSSTGSWYATQNFGTYEDVSGLTPAAPSQASAPAPAVSAGLPTAAAGVEPPPESNAPAPAAGAAGSPETAEPAGNTGADESAGTGGVAEPAESAGTAGSDESVEAADSNGFAEAAGSSGSGDVAQSGEPVGAAEPGEPNGSGDPAESAQQTGSGESGAAESAPSADSGDPAESAGTPTLEQAAPAALAEASLAPAVRVSAAEAAADAMTASSATPAAAAGQRGESGRPNGLALTGPNLAVGLTALGLVVAGLALVRRRRRA